MKVLITCGPTWVAIDDVRVISNRSTGAMGHAIAGEFRKAGARVTLIEGPVTHSLKANGIKVVKYQFFDELAQALKAECQKNYDIIIHAAAVSDFKSRKVFTNKIHSGRPLTLTLVPAEKLIDHIKPLAPKSRLVGFKLESGINARRAAQATRALFSGSGCDLAVANAVDKGYRGYIVDRNGGILAQSSNKNTLARHLVRILK
ncbi:MAG: phosphopantothenoylcysteine decarboxylase [Candidatus Omnitrophica bacterium]|nr:phosphopantothenoylcysteine decarboxylase [Candidatus Omnitrophota bacterium]